MPNLTLPVSMTLPSPPKAPLLLPSPLVLDSAPETSDIDLIASLDDRPDQAQHSKLGCRALVYAASSGNSYISTTAPSALVRSPDSPDAAFSLPVSNLPMTFPSAVSIRATVPSRLVLSTRVPSELALSEEMARG